jgi:hypothetical protein
MLERIRLSLGGAMLGVILEHVIIGHGDDDPLPWIFGFVGFVLCFWRLGLKATPRPSIDPSTPR